VLWPIATDDALTVNRRFRSIADMDRFSSRNDPWRMTHLCEGAKQSWRDQSVKVRPR
jgi:hypothetical protein